MAVGWRAENVQVVWFVTRTDEINASTLLRDFLGSEPDQSQNNRVPSASNPLLSSATSQVGNTIWTTRVLPGRLDISATPSPDHEQLSLDIDDKTQTLLRWYDRYRGIEQSVRLSTIVEIARPVANYHEAATDFYKWIGYNPDISDATDLLFQLNSRIRVPGFERTNLNRVVQASVMAKQQITFALAPPGPAPIPINTLSYFSRLQFDINTVPDGEVFSPDEQLTILRSIGREVLRLIEVGSIAGLRT